MNYYNLDEVENENETEEGKWSRRTSKDYRVVETLQIKKNKSKETKDE